jgi:hypothetical protein
MLSDDLGVVGDGDQRLADAQIRNALRFCLEPWEFPAQPHASLRGSPGAFETCLEPSGPLAVDAELFCLQKQSAGLDCVLKASIHLAFCGQLLGVDLLSQTGEIRRLTFERDYLRIGHIDRLLSQRGRGLWQSWFASILGRIRCVGEEYLVVPWAKIDFLLRQVLGFSRKSLDILAGDAACSQRDLPG